jgi:malate dehydrogenase (oxaloacetate-decarboxylating)
MMGHNRSISIRRSGRALLQSPLLNKGTAFAEDERRDLGLLGLLPPHVDTLEDQVDRAYDAFQHYEEDIEKHIFLRQLQDENEVLFYRLLLEHVAEMMPIVYTPTVGQACEEASHIYRRPRGLFISYPERDEIDTILSHVDYDIKVIVVTDGERILGLGDQGAGGMGIPIGKLSLYTLCGGIEPDETLPILLDVGTNNKDRLADPRYLGWRHERVTGDDYDAFIEKFVQAVMKRFPEVILQWEDFAGRHAGPILERYRDRLCTFNDDIQGTAAVTTATVLAAMAVNGTKERDQRFVIAGAGSAGSGVSEQLIRTLMRDGMSEEEARSRFYLIDSKGLLVHGREHMTPAKERLAQKPEAIADWKVKGGPFIALDEVVHNVKPTVLIGLTTQPGEFTEAIVRDMAAHVERPIIFPLSNPTSKAEAIPSDLMKWTNGKALVATGSPFDPVQFNGKAHVIAQCNNSYIFPALGLGICASGARRVPDELFMAAALALKDASPALKDPAASLLPPLDQVREIGRKIAFAVGTEAQAQGVADTTSPEDLQERIDHRLWAPIYPSIKRAPRA